MNEIDAGFPATGGPWTQSAGRVLSAMTLAVLLGACGTTELGPGPEDPPLVRRIDARIGVVYASAARNAKLTGPLFNIDVGSASIARLDKVFAAMFTQVSELSDWPPWREAATDLDGVIEVERIDPYIDIGNDAGGWLFEGSGKPDVVTVVYRICLYNASATLVKCWTPAGGDVHQRMVFECLDVRRCIGPMTEASMREAIAQFVVAAERDPALKGLSAQRRSAEGRP